MAETERPLTAAERSNKRKIQRYVTASFLETELQESRAGPECGETDPGTFYLNPLTPKWNCALSEKCLDMKSKEDGISVQRKDSDVRHFTEKAKTPEQETSKLKLLKVKKHYLVPQTCNVKSIEYFADVLSASSEEIWVQSQDSGEGKTAGKRNFKQTTPKLKRLMVQKQNWMEKCSDGVSSQSEEKESCVQNCERKFLEMPETSKLKLQRLRKPFLNPRTSHGNRGITENSSDILCSGTEETEPRVHKKEKTEEKQTLHVQVQEDPQTKASTHEADCAEILSTEDHLTNKNKSSECDDEAENGNQVTTKFKDLQVKENHQDCVKVSVTVKGKDDSKLSRLLESMKKRGDIDTEQRPFKCPHCHWAFKKLCYLQSHVTTHSGLKPHVCDVCGKAYSHQGTLQQHKRLHTGERPYRCPFCERSYVWSSDYRKHIRTHTGEKPYECKECGKDFIRSSDLRKHERNRHGNDKPFPCSHCDRTFNRPLSLKRHERKHLGERPFSCPDCGKTFALASRMAEHQKIHKGVRPFVCSVCAKCFTKSSNLTEHEAIHSGIRPHKCGECGVAFAMASRLVRHQYVHSKEKPHSCAGCGRNFSGLESLEQHQQLNCAGRIFVCVQCDKSFMCADKLTQHMQHHGDKTGPN